MVGAELWTRLDVGWSLFAVSRSLWVLHGPCPEHGAMMTADAFPAGRPVQLGHVRGVQDLREAILAGRDVSDLEAEQLLADLEEARIG